jgi:leucyl/phenylalanyl-tRNA---protein transferase
MMLTVLDPLDDTQPFPPAEQALEEPDGLLAVGGSLAPHRLLNAYRNGIFPWYNEGEPILWWSPNPRLTLLPERLRVSRSLRKILRRQGFQISFDRAFEAVIEGCAAPRPNAAGTWISPEMQNAYITMHQQGIAHSVESWYDNKLVGGLYGIAIGRVFFGESMFSRRSNASKAAFAVFVQALKEWNYALIDCQIHTDHLAAFGAEEMPRSDFLSLLDRYCERPVSPQAWENAPIRFATI